MLPGNEYKLVAEGTAGIIFKNETEINLNEKSFSVLVQTDKAIYKPGDTVRFRVLVLDPNMKPATIKGALNIFITVKLTKLFIFKHFTTKKIKLFRMDNRIELNNG